MDRFIQYLPYDALGKRTVTIEQNGLTIHFKNINRNFSDEYPYAKINPDFKIVSRGETEWSGVIYGLVVFSIFMFLVIKMSHGLIFKCTVWSIQFCALVTAVYLLALRFIKKDYHYIFDLSGECILSMKKTPASDEFVRKLKARLASEGGR